MNAPTRRPVCHVLHFADGRRMLISILPRPRPSHLLARLLRRAYTWLAATAGVVAGLFAMAAQAQVAATALPAGAQIVAGQATVAQSGARMNIDQASQKAILNWNSFNIGSQAQVNFNQPSAGAVALNRVLSSDASSIEGKLTANGQVFLVNPNGVLFGRNAQVDAAGFVASTMNIKDGDFVAGNYRFTRDGATAGIVNQGRIAAASGGYVALLAPEVRNEGVIQATLGTVAFAAGEAVTLDFAGGNLLSVAVDPAQVKTLIDNRSLVRADGGAVIMSAKAADQIMGSAINNSGIVEAKGLQSQDGRIVLEGADTISNTGTLDASAGERGNGGSIVVKADMDRGFAAIGGRLMAKGGASGGDGGFVETSAAKVSIAPDARITTAAAGGKTGTWLIDPNDYTIAASGGDITGAQLGSNLDGNNVTILSSQGGTAGNGDIFVNQAVSWTSANTLTLSAYRNIAVNQNLTGTGGGSLVLRADNTGTGTGTVTFGGGSISLAGGSSGKTVDIYYNPSAYNAPTNYTGNVTAGTLKSWMLVNDVNQLQSMNTNLSGDYALGKDIDASATTGWNTGAGFSPVGSQATPFRGNFDGMGRTISDLAINRPTTDWIGLFGYVDGSLLSNVQLQNENISGRGHVGGLAGCSINGGLISNVGVTGSISGYSYLGGLVGETGGGSGGGGVTRSYSAANVTGSGGGDIGGLAGLNYMGVVQDSYSTGSVTDTGNNYVGGFVGLLWSGSILRSYSTGAVTGSGQTNVGGFLGGNFAGGTVSNSYWDTQTSGQTTSAGGTGLTTAQMMQAANFTGFDFTSVWWNSDGNTRPVLRSEYSTVIGNAHQLQLMALDLNASYTLSRDIDMSELGQASGIWNTVTGFVPVGDSTYYFTGSFDGGNHVIDHLNIKRPDAYYVGLFGGSITGAVVKNVGLTNAVVTGKNTVGALVGRSYGAVSNSYNTGAVSGNSYVGGLVGENYGTVSNSYNTATVSGGNAVGGLVGENYQAVSNSYNTGVVSGTDYGIGGLVGLSANGTTISNSYNTGATSGNSYVGGIIGQNWFSTISNSYSTGAVSGTSSFGGLVGQNTAGTINASYWNTQTSGQATSAGGTGLTTAQMKQQASFSGWDFTNTWRIYEGSTYPLLKSFLAPLTLSVTANNASKAYDGIAWSGGNGVGYSGFTGGDSAANLSGSLVYGGTSQGAINAGSYTIVPGGYSSSKYDITYVNGVLIINKAPLTVTANNASKTYDGTAYSGGNGVSYSGFVNSETSAVLGGALAYGGTSQGALDAGSYSIVPSGLSSPNYAVSYVDGALTISPASLALGVAADDKSKTYGGADPALTWHVSSGSLQNGDSFSGSLTRDAGENVGNYAIRQGTLTAGGNYAISFANGVLTIGPAPLTVTANAASKTYDGLAYSGGNGVTYSGFVNNETSAALGGTLAWSGSSQGATNAGAYTITPSGLTSGNYTLTFNNGTLTVNASAAPAAAGNSSAPSLPALDTDAIVQAIRSSAAATAQSIQLASASSSIQTDSDTALFDPSGTAIAMGSSASSGAEAKSETKTAAKAEAKSGAGQKGVERRGAADIGARIAAFAAADAARHQARTDLYREALDILKMNPTVADLPMCGEGGSDLKGGSDLCIPVTRETAVQEAAPSGAAVGRQGPFPPTEPRNKIAVMIGNNAYQGRIPQLDTPIGDVQAIGEVLKSRMGYEVKVVQNAGKKDIVAALKDVAGRTTTDDSVLIMYAGHGYQLDDTRQGYWIPADANASDPKTWVSNSDISKFLNAIPAKQTILVSDSCFSGTLTKEQKVDAGGATKQDILTKRSVVAMSSGGEEPVSDEGFDNHSVFAYHLIRQLSRTQGVATAAQLHSTVTAEVRKEYPQEPQLGGVPSAGHSTGGDYLFLPR